MTKCQRCNSSRILYVSSHGKDCQSVAGVNASGEYTELVDYLPRDLGLGGGDDLTMRYCLDCGQIQGSFPLPVTEFERSDD